MLAAWVAVVLFLVALPLFAWWLGGRRVLDRAAGPDEARGLRAAMTRSHALGPAEADVVERAVTWGRALDEPRLRAAVIDLAHQRIELDRRRRAQRPRLRGWLVVVLVLWVTAVLARVVFAVAQGRWDDVNWATLLVYAVFGVQGWRRVTGPQRAIERNSGPPSSS